MSLPKSDLIFQQWKASLPDRDRGKDAAQVNFEELFSDLKAEGLDFDEVHSNFLPKAIKAHYPSSIYVRNAWKKWKHTGKWGSEKELEDLWKQETENSAEVAFFEVFPVETKGKKPVEKESPVETPRAHGNMSAKEYKVMREYADSYPSFDFEALEKEMAKVNSSAPTDDFDELLRKVDSESK